MNMTVSMFVFSFPNNDYGSIITSLNMDMNVDISLPFHQCQYCDSPIPVDECHLQVRVELYHTSSGVFTLV